MEFWYIFRCSSGVLVCSSCKRALCKIGNFSLGKCDFLPEMLFKICMGCLSSKLLQLRSFGKTSYLGTGSLRRKPQVLILFYVARQTASLFVSLFQFYHIIFEEKPKSKSNVGYCGYQPLYSYISPNAVPLPSATISPLAFSFGN